MKSSNELQKFQTVDAEQETLKARMLADIQEITQTAMPFGRFSGRPLHELPAEYLHWFVGKGWPKGRLGVLMQMVYQIKADGSEVAFDPFRSPERRLGRADV